MGFNDELYKQQKTEGVYEGLSFIVDFSVVAIHSLFKWGAQEFDDMEPKIMERIQSEAFQKKVDAVRVGGGKRYQYKTVFTWIRDVRNGGRTEGIRLGRELVCDCLREDYTFSAQRIQKLCKRLDDMTTEMVDKDPDRVTADLVNQLTAIRGAEHRGAFLKRYIQLDIPGVK